MSEAPATSTLTFTVGPDDTALALGSGDVPVLATPRLVAWLEAATCAAVAAAGLLGEGATSVGTAVQVQHVRATGVRGTVTATATVAQVQGRAVTLEVAAVDGTGEVVAHGTVSRVVVDRDRFVAKVPQA